MVNRQLIQSLIPLIMMVALSSVQSYSYRYNLPNKHYQHFDDYLINNSEKVIVIEVNEDYQESELINQNNDNNQNNLLIETTNILTVSSTTSTTTAATTTNQSPQDQAEIESVNCCHLGRLAGEHGYHCHVNFYASRILRRNENRAHNRKIYFNGASEARTMRKFESCIEYNGNLFHKCCKIASRMHLQGPRYDTAKRLRSGH